jgi:hypothetical protein
MANGLIGYAHPGFEEGTAALDLEAGIKLLPEDSLPVASNSPFIDSPTQQDRTQGFNLRNR